MRQDKDTCCVRTSRLLSGSARVCLHFGLLLSLLLGNLNGRCSCGAVSLRRRCLCQIGQHQVVRH